MPINLQGNIRACSTDIFVKGIKVDGLTEKSVPTRNINENTAKKTQQYITYISYKVYILITAPLIPTTTFV